MKWLPKVTLRAGISSTRSRVAGMYLLLLAFNIGAWCWALLAFRDHPMLLGTAFLAYSFGLRHAVDADHIAAIDNVTRKLMQEGKKPVAVGFVFSLGHSTVVLVGAFLLSLTAVVFARHIAFIRDVGSVTGTLVSAFFLFAIAIANMLVLRSVYRVFVRVRNGGAYVEEDLGLLLGGGGLMARVFRPMFRLIRSSWHMYPLGVLFGLGFDTATEVGLLGISATQATHGLPLCDVLIFPALFAAGMSLIDTTDNILMLGAYGWAFVKPVRKLYYNLTVTSISVAVAFAVGGIEVLGLLAGRLHPSGVAWGLVAKLNNNFELVGYGIVALLAAAWVASIVVYKSKGFDQLEFSGSGVDQSGS